MKKKNQLGNRKSIVRSLQRMEQARQRFGHVDYRSIEDKIHQLYFRYENIQRTWVSPRKEGKQLPTLTMDGHIFIASRENGYR